MLWYKGWLETRLRLWIALGYMGIFWLFIHSAPSALLPPASKPSLGLFLTLMMGSFVGKMCIWFPGAGIASQGSFRFLKGLHGSTQYSLSLPVTRFQLLAVRATLGWMEEACVIGTYCYGIRLVAPAVARGRGYEE